MPKNCPLGKLDSHACWGCFYEFGNSCIYNEMQEEAKENDKNKCDTCALSHACDDYDEHHCKENNYYRYEPIPTHSDRLKVIDMNMFEELKAWADKWNVSYTMKEDEDKINIYFESASWSDATFSYYKDTGLFIWYGGD
jgi:hypothetical protein